METSDLAQGDEWLRL